MFQEVKKPSNSQHVWDHHQFEGNEKKKRVTDYIGRFQVVARATAARETADMQVLINDYRNSWHPIAKKLIDRKRADIPAGISQAVCVGHGV